MTSRLAALPQGNRSHPQLRASIERSWPRGRLHRWATAGEVMRGSVVRGRARGSYRLQKSTGGAWPFTPEGEELSDHDEMGLALPRESVGEVKERRKPDRRWQNRETGGGFPQTSRVAQASRFGNTCRGKALRIGKVVPFDEGAAEAVLVPRKCPGSNHSGRLRGATGSVRGRTSASRMAEKATPRWHRQRRCPDSPSRKARRTVYGSAEAGGVPSSTRPAGVGLPQGGLASHGRTRPLRKGEKGKHPAVSAAQAARPEVERSTGARVDSRLQRSERGIFSAPSRGAARQTKVARSSTMR